jgi:molybdopterin-binding protein
MKIGARNKLKGKVVDVNEGQTTAHVRLDVRLHRHAATTNDAVDELGLKAGHDAYAVVVKASDVMIAIGT